MAEQPGIIWLWEESLWGSIATDAMTIITVTVPPLIGWALGISALEWIGALMAMMYVIGRSTGRTKKMTPQQAADYLAKEYNAKASNTAA
jgi:hypothetical protein